MTGFLTLELATAPAVGLATAVAVVFLHPALVEELVFRALLSPRPDSRNGLQLAALPSLALYVAAHPLRARFFDPRHSALFASPAYLALTALLGTACALVTRRTRSIWPAVLLHALAVDAWILLLGGWRRLMGA